VGLAAGGGTELKQKWLRLILILLAGLPAVTGCWSRKELNDIAVILALGIDKNDQGYEVSAQVLNSGNAGTRQGGDGGRLPVITYHTMGKTIPDALQRMHSMAPRRLYLSHLRVLVLGEQLARAGIGNALDYIARNHELRTDFFLLVAKSARAADILEVVTQFEPIPANSLHSSIIVSHDRWAATGKLTLQHFITEWKRDGSEPVLSGVRLNGALANGESLKNTQKIKPNTLLQHVGLGVFKQDRLVGWLDEAASKVVNYLLNQVESTEGFVDEADGGRVGFRVEKSHSTLGVYLPPDGVPAFRALVEIEADISTVPASVDLSSPVTLAGIERKIENKYNAHLNKYIALVQEEYGADIFGFGEVLHRKYPQVWKKYRNDWETRFREMEIQATADVIIRKTGSIIQPIDQKEGTP